MKEKGKKATVVKSFSVDGIEGFPIEIEASLIQGMPCISIIGLGDQAVQEVRKLSAKQQKLRMKIKKIIKVDIS